MKIHFILVLFAGLTLTNCSSKPAKPQPFLKEKQMVELLTDMHMAEAMLQQKQSRVSNMDSTRLYANSMYSKLFEEYGLNKTSFEANMAYYTYYSRELEKIYTEVDNRLRTLDSLANLEGKIQIEPASIK
ncbi:MAG: DUF4296 domain-containing protein [Bacteroidales bacterium]|jgi:hypothetical protein|nr:DUF4296 domain-containing protein [Bacteroidales bacterium]